MDLIVMGSRDARRLGLIHAALAGKITNAEGARALQLSVRQFRRLRRRVKASGAGGVVHGNRGRASGQRLSSEVRQRVVDLLTGAVKLNDHHIADLLREQEVTVSAASVRRLRLELQLPAKQRRRPPRHRRRRERAAQRGALVLVDGSPFAWLGDHVPMCTLLGAIDDATGEILALTFRPAEDLHGYTELLRGLLTGHGVPVCLYGDRSGILVRNDPHWTVEEQLAGHQHPTQFGRMLEELGVGFIPARSPQAKGRIERLWRTLQDRLAAELRLHGHHTGETAHGYLPTFIQHHNRLRAQPSRASGSAFRPTPRRFERILACRYARVVGRDNRVMLAGRAIPIPPGPYRRSWHAARVEVRELLDGRRLVLHPRHGVIAEQPPSDSPFTLRPHQRPTIRPAPVRADLPGSTPHAERARPRVPSPPRRPGIGRHTNIRPPASTHPWKRAVTPKLRGKPPEGGTESLTR